MSDRQRIALIRIGDRQLCKECATEQQQREAEATDDIITDLEMERRACLVFCDQCGRVVNT